MSVFLLLSLLPLHNPQPKADPATNKAHSMSPPENESTNPFEQDALNPFEGAGDGKTAPEEAKVEDNNYC